MARPPRPPTAPSPQRKPSASHLPDTWPPRCRGGAGAHARHRAFDGDPRPPDEGRSVSELAETQAIAFPGIATVQRRAHEIAAAVRRWTEAGGPSRRCRNRVRQTGHPSRKASEVSNEAHRRRPQRGTTSSPKRSQPCGDGSSRVTSNHDRRALGGPNGTDARPGRPTGRTSLPHDPEVSSPRVRSAPAR